MFSEADFNWFSKKKSMHFKVNVSGSILYRRDGSPCFSDLLFSDTPTHQLYSNLMHFSVIGTAEHFVRPVLKGVRRVSEMMEVLLLATLQFACPSLQRNKEINCLQKLAPFP